MNVLITLRDIERRKRIGGVGHYYRSLRPFFCEGVRYFTVGRREIRRSWRGDISRIWRDYVDFWGAAGPEVDLVVLNPSLARFGLLRDGVFLLFAKLRRKKTIVFLRGWDERVAEKIERTWRKLFLFVFGRADGMIVLSSRFKERLSHWGYRGPIWVETTTVDDRLVDGSPGSERRREGVTLLFLARIERDKGIYETVRAFEALKRDYPGCSLIIAGDGGELPAVKQFVDERQVEGVEFRGYVGGDKKRKAFQDADIYVFPSSHGEGMPNSVLEAMALGLPVVATAVGGLPEFFENGRMGFLLDTPDVNRLLAGLKRLVGDDGLRRTSGAFNADYAREHFLSSKVSRRVFRIWASIEQNDEPGKFMNWKTSADEGAGDATAVGGTGDVQ